MTTTTQERSARVEQLNRASLRKVIEPDTDLVGTFTRDQIVPDELLSIAGLGLSLSPEQKATLAKEELASILRVGVLFEVVLIAGFAFQLSVAEDVGDPRFVYALHEIGEETRHSRLFVRLIEQLEPTQFNPFQSKTARRVRSIMLPALLRRPATLDAFVLGGEEIPDLLQRLLADHADTDEYVRAVNRYHRMEEARHLAFARTTVGEHYRTTGWTDRFAVDAIVPIGIAGMFDMMVQPFVYRTVGLPVLRTWRQVRRSPERTALKLQATRAVLNALLAAGLYERRSVPPMWRKVARVDRTGQPLS